MKEMEKDRKIFCLLVFGATSRVTRGTLLFVSHSVLSSFLSAHFLSVTYMLPRSSHPAFFHPVQSCERHTHEINSELSAEFKTVIRAIQRCFSPTA